MAMERGEPASDKQQATDNERATTSNKQRARHQERL